MYTGGVTPGLGFVGESGNAVVSIARSILRAIARQGRFCSQKSFIFRAGRGILAILFLFLNYLILNF